MIVMIFDVPTQLFKQMMYITFCLKVFLSLLNTRCMHNRDDVF